MIPASQIVTAGRGASAVMRNAQTVTAGRGAAPVELPQETRSAETESAPAAPDQPTTATAGRGNKISKYKTPLLIGGGLLAIYLIYKLAQRK
jgi:hypothetical protein